jgi:putative ABC transport system substrate-binding protein
VKRRKALLSLLALATSASGSAQAVGRKARVGILIASTPEASGYLVASFTKRMAELNWVEGSSIDYVVRYAAGDTKLYRKMASEVISQKVDLIVAPFGPVARAAMNVSKEIPIVFCIVEDPVAIGLVSGLGRPGGNVTGVTLGGATLIAKRIQALSELVPSMKRLGIVHAEDPPQHVLVEIDQIGRAAKQLGIETVVVKGNLTKDLTALLHRIVQQGVQGTIGTTALHWGRRKEFPFAATRIGLPAIYDAEEFVDAGGVMSISVSYVDRYHAAASYVDRILRGARPKDLPVEEPTRYTTVINLEAAKALGIRIPQTVRLRADRVIE